MNSNTYYIINVYPDILFRWEYSLCKILIHTNSVYNLSEKVSSEIKMLFNLPVVDIAMLIDHALSIETWQFVFPKYRNLLQIRAIYHSASRQWLEILHLYHNHREGKTMLYIEKDGSSLTKKVIWGYTSLSLHLSWKMDTFNIFSWLYIFICNNRTRATDFFFRRVENYKGRVQTGVCWFLQGKSFRRCIRGWGEYLLIQVYFRTNHIVQLMYINITQCT